MVPKIDSPLIKFVNILNIFQMPNFTKAVLVNGEMGNSFSFNLYPREKFVCLFLTTAPWYTSRFNHMIVCEQNGTPMGKFYIRIVLIKTLVG